MSRIRLFGSSMFAIIVAVASMSFGGEGMKPPPPAPALEPLRALEGTWVAADDASKEHGGSLTFHVTAAGSAVSEVMFPGSPHEMLNVYHMDGDTLMMTHYCAQGIQIRMKRVESDDKNAMKFEMFDVTNMKDADAGHVGSVELIMSGDKLTEKWGFMEKDKPVKTETFEFHRKTKE